MSEVAAVEMSPVVADADKNTVMLVYILQIIGFFFGITFIAAVVVNYVKQPDLQSDLARSHFRWQIRTFWFSAAWSILGLITAAVLVGYLVLFANVVWTLYRVVRGLLRFNDGKPMYAA